jgi:Na+-driven multidrug efflux pump
MNVSNTLIDTVVFIFIGHEKPIIISALGFGMLWVSAFGIAVVYGIGTGFNTYGSQAFGAKNYPRLGILLHQTLLIMGIIVAVYAVLAFFTSPILLIIGLPEELIVEISKFCKASIFTVLSYGIH